MLVSAVKNNLDELLVLLQSLSDTEYSKPVNALAQATIGQHVRHIIEMYLCLMEKYDCAMINYDNRERNKNIESNILYATEKIVYIKENFEKEDKELILEHAISGENIITKSNYNRELLYNMEHAIHHQALIKVALHEFGNIFINENFGVAPSTIQYRKTCAQ
ncbi:DinB family protein [Flavobacterium sp. LaA7.5]|nr:DinB family protein [Flavobacterium salilacus subsp. altitudinum]